MDNKRRKVSKGWVAVSSILAAVGAVVPILVSLAIPAFSKTFESFGTDLPLLTDVVINARYFYIWLSGLCVLVAASNILLRLKPVLIVSCTFSVSLMLLLPLAAIALYLPAFGLRGV
ncbi:hypothetical protein [Marinimicrobium agarilyticum]|uniref:hypothetical protein n=1 Tax=Marinimicrobium agarilyticum TaxID=306546 RepID=UPI0012F64CA8|nr:hypothetical protein [Marinimicrobium agarilyticum]